MTHHDAALNRYLGVHHRAVHQARAARAAGDSIRAAQYDQRAEQAAALAARMGASAVIIGAPVLVRLQ